MLQTGQYFPGVDSNKDPNVYEVRQSSESGGNNHYKQKDSSGAGWSFNHPHEPAGTDMGYGHSGSQEHVGC